MNDFLTPEHQAQAKALADDIVNAGGSAQDLDEALTKFRQKAALSDRNYGESRKPTDAPYFAKGSWVAGAKEAGGRLLDEARAVSPAVAALTQSPSKTAGDVGNFISEHPVRTGVGVLTSGVSEGVIRAGQMVKGMNDQAEHFNSEATRAKEHGDTSTQTADMTRALLSYVPGVSQMLPIGEHFEQTGSKADALHLGAEAGINAAPIVGPSVGRALQRGSGRVMASLFNPVTADQADLAATTGQRLADSGGVVTSPENVRVELSRAVRKTNMSQRMEEAKLHGRGNQISPKKIFDRLSDLSNEAVGGIDTPKGIVLGDKPLAAEMAPLLDEFDALRSRRGGITAAQALRLQQGLRTSAEASGGVLPTDGGAIAERPIAEAPAGKALRLGADAITPELSKAAPELASARADVSQALQAEDLPLKKFPPARLSKNSVAAVVSYLHNILAGPAARSISAIAMNRIGTLMQRGDVLGALAVARAATANPQPQPTHTPGVHQ